MGKEFYKADVQKILKKHDVNHYSMYSTLKASVVERFNRTFKNDDVEDVYAQRQLQVNRRTAAFRVRLQRAQASDYRHATCRRNFRSPKDFWTRCTAR